MSSTVSWTQLRPGMQSAAELNDRGKNTLTATGPGPKNEDDAEGICTRLVQVLNERDGTWSAPVKGEQDIDWCSVNAAGDKLEMQVVRASNNGKLWQELNDSGSARIELDARKAADELMGAIRKKSAKYSAAQKKTMTLVLDAGRTPGHTFHNAFTAFRIDHLEECQKAGFKHIWVVGPNHALVVRLDV